MSQKKPRRPVSDRARKRAIRAYANATGVAYSVAARNLGGHVEPPASSGRTVYPPSSDEHRAWLIGLRDQRPYELRVLDTRRAGVLPVGRAEHLAQRFPPTRGEPGTGVGLLYHGESRQALLALLYLVVAFERPDLEPTAGDLAWIAELGEETAVDIACAPLDRAARGLLDHDRWTMWTRVEAALTSAERSHDRLVRQSALALAFELRNLSIRSSVDGARHTLDALLVVGDDGHAPGTRVRIRTRPYRGRAGTIVGARWAPAGPPTAYDVRPDGAPETIVAEPAQLTLPQSPVGPAAALTT